MFATANQQVMQEIVAEGLASAPQVFATNRMALIVEAGNPRAIGGLGDRLRLLRLTRRVTRLPLDVLEEGARHLLRIVDPGRRGVGREYGGEFVPDSGGTVRLRSE